MPTGESKEAKRQAKLEKHVRKELRKGENENSCYVEMYCATEAVLMLMSCMAAFTWSGKAMINCIPSIVGILGACRVIGKPNSDSPLNWKCFSVAALISLVSSIGTLGYIGWFLVPILSYVVPINSTQDAEAYRRDPSGMGRGFSSMFVVIFLAACVGGIALRGFARSSAAAYAPEAGTNARLIAELNVSEAAQGIQLQAMPNPRQQQQQQQQWPPGQQQAWPGQYGPPAANSYIAPYPAGGQLQAQYPQGGAW